jgi:hypothetical protein
MWDMFSLLFGETLKTMEGQFKQPPEMDVSHEGNLSEKWKIWKQTMNVVRRQNSSEANEMFPARSFKCGKCITTSGVGISARLFGCIHILSEQAILIVLAETFSLSTIV